MPKTYYVYILASKKNGTLYIGITSNLVKRVWEHKNKVAKGFTEKYHVDQLVSFEQYNDPKHAIRRESSLRNTTENGKLISSRKLILSGTICTI